MRRADLTPDRQALLVPCEGRPNVSAMVPPPTPRTILDAPVARFTEAERALARLGVALIGFPNVDLLTRTLARREAVQSSQIEGTRSDLPQLLTYEATQSMEGIPADVQVTQRYVQALQVGLDAIRNGGRSALTLDLVNALHDILMQDARAGFPRGRYRTNQVWIGGNARIEDATFVPAPPNVIAESMENLEREMLQYAHREDEQGALAILGQLAIAHAQFETIHPYEDGNGRTGRLLIPLILAAEQYPPLYVSGVLLRYRQAYYDALSSVQLRGDWTPWVTLLARAIVESCDDVIAIAADVAAIVAGWHASLATMRSHAVARRLPNFLVGHPIVSVKQVAEGLGVSVRAANTAMQQLLDRGIVAIPDAAGKTGRIFHATAILQRLEAR